MVPLSSLPPTAAQWATNLGQLLILALGTYLAVGPHSMVAASLLLGFGAGVALSGSV